MDHSRPLAHGPDPYQPFFPLAPAWGLLGHRFGSHDSRVLPAGGRPRPPAPGKGHGHWIGSSKPAVRSSPKARLNDSTPCPEAPLTRLSSALVTTAFSSWAATLTRQRLVWLASLVVGLFGSTR